MYEVKYETPSGNVFTDDFYETEEDAKFRAEQLNWLTPNNAWIIEITK